MFSYMLMCIILSICYYMVIVLFMKDISMTLSFKHDFQRNEVFHALDLHRHPSCIGGHGLPTTGTEHCTMRLVHYLVGLRWVGMVYIGHVFPSRVGEYDLQTVATL